MIHALIPNKVLVYSLIGITNRSPVFILSLIQSRHEQKTRVVSRESVFKYKFTQASPNMVYDISQKFFAKLTAKLADKTNQFLVSQVFLRYKK